jgi:hypothetical protein
VGAVVPGPLLGRVIRAGLGGVVKKVFAFLLDSIISLGSFSPTAKRSSFASRLSAIAPQYSKFGPWPTTTENSSEMRGRGREFFGGT